MKPLVPGRAIKSILVTAGPTREHIDPVRFISNYSTGTFGYEIARQARARGYKVILVSGPTCLTPPRGVKFIAVETAGEMRRAVLRNRADCVIMAAAVCDWRPAQYSTRKLKKDGKTKYLKLTQNPDIIKDLSGRKRGMLVGFALETDALRQNAISKLKKKNLDLVVANRLNKGNNLFGDNIIDVIMIDRHGRRSSFRNKTKRQLAKIILDKALNFNI